MVSAIQGTTTLGVGMMEGTAAFRKQRPGTVLTHVGSGSSFTGGGTVSIGQYWAMLKFNSKKQTWVENFDFFQRFVTLLGMSGIFCVCLFFQTFVLPIT